jgi:hypothetical protein
VLACCSRQLGDFPLIAQPAHSQDSLYDALAWQRTAVQVMMNRFALSKQTLADQLEVAR